MIYYYTPECIVSTLDEQKVIKSTVYLIYLTHNWDWFENFNIIQKVFKYVFGKHAFFPPGVQLTFLVNITTMRVKTSNTIKQRTAEEWSQEPFYFHPVLQVLRMA